MTHSTGHSPHSPRQQINFRITQLIQIQYDPILETLENSGIELQCTVNTVMGTQTRAWQAAGADALRGAWQEHIPIQQSLRPLAYKLCRHASLERKENIQCSNRELLKLLSPFQNFCCLWRMHAYSTVLQCYGSPIKKNLSYKIQRV